MASPSKCPARNDNTGDPHGEHHRHAAVGNSGRFILTSHEGPNHDYSAATAWPDRLGHRSRYRLVAHQGARVMEIILMLLCCAVLFWAESRQWKAWVARTSRELEREDDDE